MSLVPISTNPGLTVRQGKQVSRQERQAAIRVYSHQLDMAVAVELDRIDSLAGSDAIQAALDEELNLLDYGLSRADGSAAKTELVARKVQLFSSLNDRRLIRRFGG